jgi:hypothetical protein
MGSAVLSSEDLGDSVEICCYWGVAYVYGQERYAAGL